ncbi:hypothetical protein RO3G_12297 [Rhizopus delemar RA 99-880]|uniref:Uncharacterized protein n=1 Tax=Rhizopus delemar (strain RA 99-880 / ATCC MYA-4621 / FGSC 9543 / NRRL 43880) TaxID=246409 RepID=I1CGK6_RHIO9|nr:hypothetical protein RO3G_12297 [Rhizopus delemar RA 99-880]|eukprot:EIE87586.1 hypothetical protein RO3G_12297 [Rhizopus delemar RA 99-880]
MVFNFMFFPIAVMDNKLALALKHLELLSRAITISCPLSPSDSGHMVFLGGCWIIWLKKFFYLPQFVLNIFRSDVYRGTFTMHWPVFYSNSLKKLGEPSRRK